MTRIAASVALAVALVASAAAQDQTTPVFEARIENVKLDVSVVRDGEVVEGLTAGGGTALNDALVAALLRSDTGRGRPMVLVFTDGRNSLNWLEPRHVLGAAREMGAVVHGIVARDTPRDEASSKAHAAEAPPQVEFLTKLADLTGGEVLHAEGDDLAPAFHRILKTLQSRYVLRYVPSGVKGAGWHTLRVRLSRGGGDVRVRASYRHGD